MKFTEKEAFEQENRFGTGQPNTAYAQYFVGESYLNPLTDPKGGLFAATSPLSRGAAITGTSTTRSRAAVSCCCAPPGRAGTRRRASRR